MGTKGQLDNGIPTFTEVRTANKNLEVLLDSAQKTNRQEEYYHLLNDIEVFINLCQPLIELPNLKSGRKINYAQSTLNQVENWVGEWESIASIVLREKVGQKRGIVTLFSVVGRFFQLKSRANYSDADLPDLPPAEYLPNNNSLALVYDREYEDDDLPQYSSL